MDSRNYVIPEFKINDTGRVYCKKHSNYNDDEGKLFPEFDIFRMFRGEGKLICERCLHYTNDDCYFSKDVIKQIRKDMRGFRKRHKCDICSGKIEYLSKVLRKLIAEHNSGPEISLICDICYKTLENREMLETGKKYAAFLLVPVIMGFGVFTLMALFSIESFLRNLV